MQGETQIQLVPCVYHGTYNLKHETSADGSMKGNSFSADGHSSSMKLRGSVLYEALVLESNENKILFLSSL